VKPGALFVCMPSKNTDSHAFIPEAVRSGAVAVLTHSREGYELAAKSPVARVLVEDEGLRFPEHVWRICRAFYHNPTKQMKVIGVTGTNGKTTTAWLLRDMLVALGSRSAYLGTLGFQTPSESRELLNTTPFSVDLFKLLADARDEGVQSLAIEVSSHALSERRIDGVDFDAAVFTNLSQDHLDFHRTMEEYASAKLRLFQELGPRSGKNFVSAINTDDRYGEMWAEMLGANVLTYGQKRGDLIGVAEHVELERMRMSFSYRQQSRTVDIPIGGSFNTHNCLSAAAGMLALGYSLEDVAKALPKVRPVPGRFEPVPNNKGIGVIVDYAHTPDALQKLLDSVRMLHPRRILTVFGCGGDRDRAKRPKMAKAASERSDLVVLTSDNPRTEDPAEILKEVETGLVPGAEALSIIDRREAIQASLKRAQPGDVVVIAGKGHENYQIIGRQKMPMDDRQIAREALGS